MKTSVYAADWLEATPHAGEVTGPEFYQTPRLAWLGVPTYPIPSHMVFDIGELGRVAERSCNTEEEKWSPTLSGNSRFNTSMKMQKRQSSASKNTAF